MKNIPSFFSFPSLIPAILAFGSLMVLFPLSLSSSSGGSDVQIMMDELVFGQDGHAYIANQEETFSGMAIKVDDHGVVLESITFDHGVVVEKFPLPLEKYEDESMQLIQMMKHRITDNPFNLVASLIFFFAICHTFMAGFFRKLAHKYEHEHHYSIKQDGRSADNKPHEDAIDEVSFKGKLFHFLGEVEAIFGIWVLPLCIAIFYFKGWGTMINYISHHVDYTEPMFVVIIMTIASTRPVLKFAENCMRFFADLGKGTPAAWWFSILTLGPILGSFITEPAAMTISALLLATRFYDLKPSPVFAYGTIGLLFVNVSVGGTLTHFAAPPVLMVVAPWKWDFMFMLTNFGWKAFIGIMISNFLYLWYFRNEFAKLQTPVKGFDSPATPWRERADPIPNWITLVHLFFLGWTVVNVHNPAMFIGGFLFFLAFTEATFHHQNDVDIRPALLVGFFLAGLKIHGECQGWWISPVLTSLSEWPLMIGATVLTAFNDNAAITFLASQVHGFTDTLKYAVVAGAVTGGGLTVIANAPNPAGQSILQRYFENGVSPARLALGAMIPTIILGACFMLMR